MFFFSLTNSDTVSETNPNKKTDTETSNACLDELSGVKILKNHSLFLIESDWRDAGKGRKVPASGYLPVHHTVKSYLQS